MKTIHGPCQSGLNSGVVLILKDIALVCNFRWMSKWS